MIPFMQQIFKLLIMDLVPFVTRRTSVPRRSRESRILIHVLPPGFQLFVGQMSAVIMQMFARFHKLKIFDRVIRLIPVFVMYMESIWNRTIEMFPYGAMNP